MIVVDPLFDATPFTRSTTPRCFRNTRSCHMMSTLPGVEGTRELIQFARRIGLQARWIQRPGTPLEHFDLTESKRKRALELGAQQVPHGWRRPE